MFLLSLNFAQGECLVLDLNASESKSKFEKPEILKFEKEKDKDRLLSIKQTLIYKMNVFPGLISIR